MIVVARDALQQIVTAAETAYPAECCGLLVGRQTPNGVVHATRAHASANVSRERNRFEIDPRLWVDLSRALGRGPLKVVGLYHSHPEGPAQPSRHDLNAAWGEELVWIIASVSAAGDGAADGHAGQVIQVTAHILDHDGRQFRPLELRTPDWAPYAARELPRHAARRQGDQMNFASDNAAGAHPKILAALTAANQGAAMPYGADELTQRVEKRISEMFERDCAVFLVGTGTAANVLALSCLTPPYGVIYCHTGAHIANDECGAPEFFTGGARLTPLPGENGKVDAATLDAALRGAGAGVVHQMQPASVSLTQATEAGTVYTSSELGALAEIAKRHKVGLHVDGARFANAVAGSNASPADLTWRAGVDVLSFGATKNGALAAEAVVFFDRAKAAEFGYRRKRGGQLWSKMRFLSAQWDAYLADDLWLTNARHANAMARRLGQGLAGVPGARLAFPVDANEVFVALPRQVIERLTTAGWKFYRWPHAEPDATTLRLVASFDTDPKNVDRFIAQAKEFAAQ